MNAKQLFSIIMTAFWALVLIVMGVWMIVTGSYRLWAVWLAVWCCFAVFLRMYALEWRRLKDEREGRK